MLNAWEVPARPTSDLQFVGRSCRNSAQAGGRLPTVYCSVGEAGDVWLIVRAQSYFTRQQICGNLFFRETALEGQRRARLLRRFEQERTRCYVTLWPDAVKRNQEELFEAPLDEAPPTLDDLAAVCQEEGVDYVAVPEAFDVPCAASNGRIYIYDCRRVRAALGHPSTATAARLTLQRRRALPSLRHSGEAPRATSSSSCSRPRF